MNLLVKKRMFLGGLLFCMMVLLLYFVYTFNEGKQIALQYIYSLCIDAIHLDQTNRLEETGTSSSSGYKPISNDTITTLHTNGHVERIVRNNNLVNLKTEEKMYRVDQSYLLFANPINVVVLDSLFNSLLLQNHYRGVRTALAYTVNNDSTIYSNQDSTFYHSKFALPPVTTGIHDEIVLQAYVDMPFYNVIIQNKVDFIIIGALFFLSLGFFFLTWYNKKYLIPLQETTRKLIKIKENLLFDKEKGVLYFNGDIQVALSNRRLDIFVLLLESPEHFQTSKEIIRIVWGNGGTSDVLNSTLKRLRDNLEPIPDIKIVHENSGYCLHID